MKRLAAALFLCMTSPAAFAAAPCSTPYDKILPYDLPLGGDNIYVALTSEVRFRYDCTSAFVQGSAGAFASFMSLDVKLLNANLLAKTNMNGSSVGGSLGTARVQVLGYEVVNEGLDLENLVQYDPSQDLDISNTTTFNVGPVPIPVTYGVEGVAGLAISGGVESLGLGVHLTPHIDSQAYVQAGASLAFVEAVIRGDMIVLNDELDNLLHVGIKDGIDSPEIRFTATSNNRLYALDGAVQLNARVGMGAMSKTYNRTLFDWPGYNREDFLFEFSDRLAILQ